MTVIMEGTLVLLLIAGGVFSTLAAVGIVVMSDVYTRMQAASKAVTLGATSVALAAAVHFQDPAVTARCVLVAVFLVVTVPATSHLIARAAYRAGEPCAPETVVDEAADRGDMTQR